MMICTTYKFTLNQFSTKLWTPKTTPKTNKPLGIRSSYSQLMCDWGVLSLTETKRIQVIEVPYYGSMQPFKRIAGFTRIPAKGFTNLQLKNFRQGTFQSAQTHWDPSEVVYL